MTPRFSIVIPTFQRRELVQECVLSLQRQRFDGQWEIVVVVDGSTDGTAEALQGLDLSVPLAVVEQPNSGSAAARNRGARASTGEIVLFLDDDMEADENLLSEHDRSHREGNDVVLGDMPTHPDSPATLLTEEVEEWSKDRIERLSDPDATLTFLELLGGQISVKREAIEEIGGFDPSFTARSGDVDFGYRLLRSGRKITFNPAAVSRQKYVVSPATHLRHWYGSGRSTVALLERYPEAREDLRELIPPQWGLTRWLWRPLLSIPLLGRALLAVARTVALFGVRDGRGSKPARKLFFAVRDAELLRGTIEAGGIPDDPPVCVLGYHAAEALPGHPLEPYGVDADLLGRQLDAVAAAGFRFTDLDEVLTALRGEAPEAGPLALVTFDDCYESVLSAALPVLEARGIPAVALAVSARLGATNEWSTASGADGLPLLDANGLRRLAAGGIEIGAHSATHRQLTGLAPEELASEIQASVDQLADLGLPRPRAFAYPYGELDDDARTAVRDARLEAAFTTRIGFARPSSDRFALPRIEMTARDDGWRLRLKLKAASAPGPIARRVAEHSLR